MSRTKQDKIFDNSFGESSFEFDGNIAFKVDPVFENRGDTEEQLYYTMLYDEIDRIIKDSKYNKFNEVNSEGEYINLNKSHMNSLFEHVLGETKGRHSLIDVWYTLINYFALNSSKMYMAIANKYKDTIIRGSLSYSKKNNQLENMY